jgi:hypothetical protein
MGQCGYCELLLRAIRVYGDSINTNDHEILEFSLKALKNMCSESGNQKRVNIVLSTKHNEKPIFL